MTGYDFAVLESFQRFLHRTADSLDLDVSEWYVSMQIITIFHKFVIEIYHFSWATPAKQLHVTKLKMKSTTVEGEYDLKIYERNVQVC